MAASEAQLRHHDWYSVADRVIEQVLLVDEEATPSEIHQLAVLLQAWQKFRDRNAKRHDLWKEFGTEDSALQLRSKAARIALTLRPDLEVSPEDVEDDAIDAINYAVFFYRNTHGF